MAGQRNNRKYGRLRAAQWPVFLPLMWALASAAANLVWEFAQLPLYTLSDDPDTGKIIRYVLHCTGGDVLIALGIYALTALALREWAWPLREPWRGIMLASALGLAYTAVSEWHNVYGAAEWAYGENMPLVFGIGLAPLLQWLLMPPLVLLIVRWAGKKAMQDGHPDGDGAGTA